MYGTKKFTIFVNLLVFLNRIIFSQKLKSKLNICEGSLRKGGKVGAHEEKLPKILYESSFGDKKILLFPPALGKYR